MDGVPVLKRSVVVIFLCFLMLQPLFSESESTFTMIINRPEDSPLYKWTSLIYSEVFRRLNIEFNYLYFPLKRASEEVNSGRFDGEPARIFDYGRSYPDLIRVEESVFDFRVVAMASDPAINNLNGWESLKGKGFFVEYPRGMLICEQNLKAVVTAGRLASVNETRQGLLKLAAGRIDLYVDDINSIFPVLAAGPDSLDNDVHVAGVMHEAPLYMFVHKKHKELVSEIEGILRDMKAEGLIELYYKIAF